MQHLLMLALYAIGLRIALVNAGAKSVHELFEMKS